MVRPGGLVVLTDRRAAAGRLLPVVEAAVRGGAGWVVLRERDLPYPSRRALADRLRQVVPPGRLIVAGPDPLGGDAVHLAGADPVPLRDVALVGRSCHGVPELSIEDYVTLSPIYPTETKPGYGPALGPATAAGLAAQARVADRPPTGGPPTGGSSTDRLSTDRLSTDRLSTDRLSTGRLSTDRRAHGRARPVPWLALGGIDAPEKAAACAAAGAAGVAVLGAVMRSPDPERSAAELAGAFAGACDEASAGADDEASAGADDEAFAGADGEAVAGADGEAVAGADGEAVARAVDVAGAEQRLLRRVLDPLGGQGVGGR